MLPLLLASLSLPLISCSPAYFLLSLTRCCGFPYPFLLFMYLLSPSTSDTLYFISLLLLLFFHPPHSFVVSHQFSYFWFPACSCHSCSSLLFCLLASWFFFFSLLPICQTVYHLSLFFFFLHTHSAPTLDRFFRYRKLSTFEPVTLVHFGGMLWLQAVHVGCECVCVHLCVSACFHLWACGSGKAFI